MSDNAIINPQKGKASPEIGPLAVMVATEPDLSVLGALLKLNPDRFQKLFISKLYMDNKCPPQVSLVGPFIGAAYAAMLLETLIAWGARTIIFFGWCGAIAAEVKIGDIILPASTFIDEGTSPHYLSGVNESAPSEQIVSQLAHIMNRDGLSFHHGIIWSTDAVYRETREKVTYFQKKNALAVEMEASAIFTVAKFRGIAAGGILVVSDELSDFNWRPGFGENHFIQGRLAACTVVQKLCRSLSIPA